MLSMRQTEIRRLPNTNRMLDESKMSEELIAYICKANGGFRTPELNEKLYLHFKGFSKMEGLQSFVNCRALWLENNIITDIEGLDQLTVLDSLFLQHNQLTKLPTSLGYTVSSLRSINISHNSLVTLHGIEHFPNLEKLLVSNNRLECVASLGALEGLTILDISHNRLAIADNVRDVLRKAKKLASVMMHGNDFIKDVKNYRKVIIDENPCLKFVDEYPVFDDERRCSAAFVRGGIESEKVERALLRQEETERQNKQRRFFNNLVDSARDQRTEVPIPPTPYFQQMQEDDDVYVPVAAAPTPTTALPEPRRQMSAGAGTADKRANAVRSQKRLQRHVDANANLTPAVCEPSATDIFDVVGEEDILSIFRLDDAVSAAILDAVKHHK